MNSATLTGLAFMALGVSLLCAWRFAADHRTGLRRFAGEACIPYFALGVALLYIAAAL